MLFFPESYIYLLEKTTFNYIYIFICRSFSLEQSCSALTTFVQFSLQADPAAESNPRVTFSRKVCPKGELVIFRRFSVQVGCWQLGAFVRFTTFIAVPFGSFSDRTDGLRS